MGTRSGTPSGRPAGSGGDRDERLMQRVKRGDVGAFEVLFERYRARLFGFLIRRCGDAATAEDLIQETWLRAIRARDRFDARRRFSTWLFQIANNLCRDRARRLEVAGRGERELRAQHAQLAVGHAVGPGGSASAPAQLRLEMAERLAQLPDRLREVLVLRYYRDLSEAEIAEIIGTPRGTVKSRLHQAVRVLREREDPT